MGREADRKNHRKQSMEQWILRLWVTGRGKVALKYVQVPLREWDFDTVLFEGFPYADVYGIAEFEKVLLR